MKAGHKSEQPRDGQEIPRTDGRVFRDFEGCLDTGFQIATFQGPMCAEPMEGMAFFVESFEVDASKLEGENGEGDAFDYLRCSD